MADVYLIYAKEDKDFAQKLHSHLSEQWTVWWDDDMSGKFRGAIESELKHAGCVVSVNSKHSREKTTVVEEMRLATDYGRTIIPVMADNASLPYLYGDLSKVEMGDWSGSSAHEGLMQLKRKLTKIITPKQPPKRPNCIANSRIKSPTLFLSVSSFNTQLKPADAIRMLSALQVPAILVSAYDLSKQRDPAGVISELSKYRAGGGFILIDSGNYEKDRLGLGNESWSLKQFREVLTSIPYDWAFCYDDITSKTRKNTTVSSVVKSVLREKNLDNILPIVHAPKLNKRGGGYDLDQIPHLIRQVSEELTPPIIAIPERELGAGLIARAKTIKLIRNELNKLSCYQPIHILGTGNPWAVAVFAAAGADTFDGLEWCRYAIFEEDETININHFHLLELYTEISESKIGYPAEVVFKNIQFFKEFNKIMQEMHCQEKVESHVRGVLSKSAYNLLCKQCPGLIK